ncbi:unnamed protein product [Pleuronectes platessa]|uniref:Uncharacterized protein n=1 Tax=Pleuronectes platessa TaxID=8262 RepID=A0A9N7UCR1_PLEPL|nr:unnamed protein product [Pleuronectes platessa]
MKEEVQKKGFDFQGKRVNLDHDYSPELLKKQREHNAEGGPPRERRVPPADAVPEVIREKGPTHVQSLHRRPPYPVPSNRSPPSALRTDTAPRSKRKKAPTAATRTRTPPPTKKKR